MSRLYWDTHLLSPLLTMDHKSLKRSRSAEALDRGPKRSKLLASMETPLSVASNHLPFTSNTPSTALPTLYPNSIEQQQQQEQQEQQQEQAQQQQQQSLLPKPISISTRSTQESSITASNYQNMNSLLYNIHVARYGDPETRESWWREESDIEMADEEDNMEYNDMNSVLRQAFLQRRHQQ